MSEKPQSTKIVLGILIAALVFTAGYALRHTLSSFLLAFIMAYLLDPFIVMMERRKVRRLLCIALLYLILVIFGFLIFVYLIPFVSLRWDSLLTELPKYAQKGKEIIIGGTTKFNPTLLSGEWPWLLDKTASGINSLMGKLGAGIYSAVGSVAFNLLNLFLAPILVFFMLYYKRDILSGISAWLPDEHRQEIEELGREIDASVGGYIRGQLIVSLIVAILATIALFYMEIDYPVINGIFAGLASILPFIGVILAMLPPLFFAYVKFQSGITLVKVIGAFSLIYFMEGYLIKPLIFKKSMDLNPLVTIIVVMALGELFGFWGILLAIPIAAAVKIIMAHARNRSLVRKG
jgi:putative permease